MQLAGLEISDAEQGSPEWLAARLGIPTASKFQCLLAKSADRKGRDTYLYDLAGEIIRSRPSESFRNEYMDRGHVVEPEALAWYEFTTGVEVDRVGFVYSPFLGAGASPDGLVSKDGGVEAKSRLPRLQMKLAESGELPNEHRAQVQGSMWVLGRPWWDYLSYCEGLRPVKIRVMRDEPYIATIAIAVKEFNADLKALVEKHR